MELKSIKKGDSYNELRAIYEQLPFFCCYGYILNRKCQKDISKYVYCTETGTPPYTGTYGDTPNKWIEKFYIIKNAIEMKKGILREKSKSKLGANNGNK